MANVPQKLLVLDNAALVAAARNPTVAREFPFLASLARYAGSSKTCTSCGQTAADRSMIEAAKSTMAYMDDAQKLRLKTVLNAESIEVYLQTARGSQAVRF